MLVQDTLKGNAERNPEKIAVIDGSRQVTYHEIHDMVTRLAYYLVHLGLQKGDRVIIFLDNSIEAVVSMYGVMQAGGTFILPNPTMKAGKLNYIIADSGAKIIISHACKLKTIIKAIDLSAVAEDILWWHGNRIPEAVAKQTDNERPRFVLLNEAVQNVTIEPNDCFPRPLDIDLAMIIYTSGSTGFPKGVMSAHYNVLAAARSITTYLNNQEDDVILCALPMSFDYGLYQIIMAFMIGATVVLQKSFAFPYKVLESIDEHQVTGFPIVPTMLALIFELDDPSRFHFASLRYITNTAATLPPAYIRRFKKLWPHVEIFSMYGLTECKRVSFVPPPKLEEKINSVGIPMPNVETFVVDKEGKEAAPGQIGELVVRGANVMQGYWNAPEETAFTFRAGAYHADTRLYTGDFFKKDSDGYLYYVARNDDLIKIKGERVSPKEIENAICEMPGVVAAAVIGIPDPIFGQIPKAYVVARDDSLNSAKIKKFCQMHLEPLMIPQMIQFIRAMPKLNNGKIDRQALDRSGRDRRLNQDRRNNFLTDANHLYPLADRRRTANRRAIKDRRAMTK